jgi:hypothetical protein
MKRLSVIAIFLCFLAVLPGKSEAASDYRFWSPVATYPYRNDADRRTEARVAAILSSHGIKRIVSASLSASVEVPMAQAPEARRLLETAIQEEGLAVTLVPPWVEVATYVGSWETIEVRLRALLQAEKIPSNPSETLPSTIAVPPAQAAAARRVLEKALQQESLPLTLLPAKGNQNDPAQAAPSLTPATDSPAR